VGEDEYAEKAVLRAVLFPVKRVTEDLSKENDCDTVGLVNKRAAEKAEVLDEGGGNVRASAAAELRGGLFTFSLVDRLGDPKRPLVPRGWVFHASL
jgi:hypothetical protein